MTAGDPFGRLKGTKHDMSMRPKDERLVPRRTFEPEALPDSKFDLSDAIDVELSANQRARFQAELDRARAKIGKMGEYRPTVPEHTKKRSQEDELVEYLTNYLGDEVFAQRFADCMSIIRRKNADYSQGEQKGDRIAAFRRIGRDIGVTMPQAWAVFAQKHWGAVMKYVKDGILESEGLGERINDLINYFVLLGAIVEDIERREQGRPDDEVTK